ncbi:MFS transporter [Orrella marina]|uniref:MFS transporter n=1 Tax=Orrella marina TaxID=2163011 RepID=UPI0026966842|nr:MFS transporter [Orrella marina]
MSSESLPLHTSPQHLPEHQSREHRHRWLILTIVSSALFLIVVDVTVLYLALPHLTHDLHASASQKLWIVNAYALTVAGLLPGAGALADRYGYKRMFVGGMVVFGIASLIAAFSPDPQTLIAARVLLAVGAAMMMPATLAIIRHVFEDPHERSVAIGIWAAIASGGAALGPVVGGLLLEYFWWGSVFLLNVPVIAVALIPALIWIPRSQSNPDRPFDLVASLLIMLALVGLTFAIKEASATEPSILRALLALALSALGAAAFVLRQKRTRVVLIDFKLFDNKVFSAGAVTALVASATLMGMELAVSQRFQLIAGMSPLQAGLALLPIPLAAFFA